MMTHLVLLIIALPFAINATNSPKVAESTLVFENHGVILKPQGLIALNSNKQHVSLFQKIQLPQVNRTPNCATWFSKDWINEANSLVKQNTIKYINMFKNVANPDSTPKRTKRSAIAGIGITLGLGLVDLLFTGISYKTLKSHISRVEHKFDQFVSTQHRFNQKIIEIDENIVQIIDSLKSDVNAHFETLECKMLSATGRLFANQLIFQWNEKLNTLFKSAISGQITIPLTPDILTSEDLLQIIKDHKILKTTYFSKNA
jgi:hypothetical protein